MNSSWRCRWRWYYERKVCRWSIQLLKSPSFFSSSIFTLHCFSDIVLFFHLLSSVWITGILLVMGFSLLFTLLFMDFLLLKHRFMYSSSCGFNTVFIFLSFGELTQARSREQTHTRSYIRMMAVTSLSIMPIMISL